MVRTAKVRSRFAAFVITIFALAIVVASSYLFFGHPGDNKYDVKPLSTSSILSTAPAAG